MNILIIIIVVTASCVLIVFTIIRNNKDRKKFERQLTKEDSTIRHGETDIETDDDKLKSSQ